MSKFKKAFMSAMYNIYNKPPEMAEAMAMKTYQAIKAARIAGVEILRELQAEQPARAMAFAKVTPR